MNEIINPSTSTHFSIPHPWRRRKRKIWGSPWSNTKLRYMHGWGDMEISTRQNFRKNRWKSPIFPYISMIWWYFVNFFGWSTWVNTRYSEGLNLLLRGLESQTKDLNLLLKGLEPQTKGLPEAWPTLVKYSAPNMFILKFIK